MSLCLRDCPPLKAEEGVAGGSWQLVLSLLVPHSSRERKKDGWDSSGAVCVFKPWGTLWARLQCWSCHGQQARNASRK